MIEIVAKVGGSLSRGTGLRELCLLLSELGRDHNLMVVPGGGPFADTVRKLDDIYRLSAHASHWMAVLAMDQFGWLLADLIPGSEPVRNPDAAHRIARAGKVPVFLPFDMLCRADPLPHGWQVTSDSIATWAAESVGAPRLVLLKSAECPVVCGPGDSDVPGAVTLEQLAHLEIVDPYLATVLSANDIDLWIINGNEPDRLRELVETGSTPGVRLRR